MQFDCCRVDPINERCQRSQATTGAKKNLMVWKVRKSTTQSASPKFFEVFFMNEHIKTLASDEHACAVRVHSAAPS